MFNSHEFYKKRLSAHMKELGRYTRYILNGHMVVVMFFLISATAFYYQQWLTVLPENFPTALVIGVSLGLLVSYSPVRTLLQEPDLVFIIVAEDKMNAYFRNSIIYSFVVQLYLILLLVAAFSPLYFAAFPERTGTGYLLTLAIVLLFKIGNLIANWWMLKVREAKVRQIDLLARTLLNIAIFYFIIQGNLLLAGIITALFAFLFLYDYNISKKQAGIAWDLLVEKDQNRMQSFYRFANMFADVPHLKNRTKKRHWLVSVVSSRILFARKHTYDYLFRITFIRSGDYLGMYLRLIVIGGLFIFLIPNVWMKALFGLLFIYLSSFQMMPLYQHFRTNIWLDLYPVDQTIKKDAVLKIILQLSIVQVFIYALLFIAIQEYLGFLVFIVAGALFSILFINGYIKSKLV
ncbi:ABC transporter permease [Oceanobacillus chungangensis]|uniref:ABC transporter permease n=1 Tax=Oceanobacillus chungangensis TaxID=1229152 RepID=A0A3D8PXN2_9BACI|nr:ABC transporter permease [Oceanobacillus chungangensis]RDW19899.1 ABC transporter permease [Oceanobacillus chungangensis]